MPIPSLVLFLGDPYRCERALAERDAAIRGEDPTCERHARFADEVDVTSLDIELQSAPLFSLGRHFVIRRVDGIRKPAPWVEALGRPLPPATFVTLVAGELKSTSPLAKLCQTRGEVTTLPAPPPRDADQSVRALAAERGLRLRPEAIEILARRTGGNLLSAAEETAKLAQFAPEGDVSGEIADRLVFPAAEPTAYPFYDRLGERDLSSSLRALAEVRDDAGRLLGGAVRHLARLAALRLLVERGVPQSEITQLAGLPPWLLRRLLPQAKRFRLEEAAAALDLGVRLDAQVKSGGIQASDALLKLAFDVTRSSPPRGRG
ncbi:MAG: DNA polymerase III subunit delta [Thermotogota bacterium]